MQASPRARQAKSKARLAAYDALVDAAMKGPSDPAEISIPPGPRLGDIVIEANGLGKAFGDVSGGERNRVHLARLLKDGGNLILLDEPTNDLDVETLQALENALLGFPGCVVVISHDRWFLDRIATHILAFEGDSQVTWFAGNYQAYEEDRKKRLGEDAAQPHRVKFRKLAH